MWSSNNDSNFSCPNIRTAFFGSQTCVLLILTIFSIKFSVILMNILFTVNGSFHANVRLVLQNFCAANLLTSCLLLFRAIHSLTVLTFGYDAWNFPDTFCNFVEHLRNMINAVAMVSMSVIGFERLLATIRHKYFDPERSTCTMKLILIMVWLGNMIIAIQTSLKSTKGVNTCYCFSTSSSDTKGMINFFIPYLVVEIATVASFVIVLYMNKRLSSSIMNISKHSLQSRYMISNNMSTTRCLLPTVVSNSLLYLVIVGLQILLKLLAANYDMNTAINSWSATFLLVSFGCFVEPILLVKYNKKFRSTVQKKLAKFGKTFCCFKKSTKKVQPIDLSIISFKLHPEQSQQILNDIWSKKPPTKFR